MNDLRERRWLRWHALLIGAVTLALCWAVSAALRAVGLESLMWRPLLSLLLTYPLYLGLLALWVRWLLSRDRLSDPGRWDGTPSPSFGSGAGESAGPSPTALPPFQSGGGGDFGGGGASASFESPDVGDGLLEAVGDAAGQVGGKALSGVADAVGAADDGAAVVIPLLVVVGVAAGLAAALGFAVFGLFGVDVLLGVAVELAFASMGGALAWRARREGWLLHAFRRTAMPLLGLMACLALVDWLLQTWVPQAHTLPQALKLLFA